MRTQLCRSLIAWLLPLLYCCCSLCNVVFIVSCTLPMCIGRINYLCKKIESLVMIHDYFMMPSSLWHCSCLFFFFFYFVRSNVSIVSQHWWRMVGLGIRVRYENSWTLLLYVFAWVCVYACEYRVYITSANGSHIIKVIWPYFHQINRVQMQRISYLLDCCGWWRWKRRENHLIDCISCNHR